MIDGEIQDTDPSSDALTAEEAAAFEEMRSDTGKPEPRAEPEAEKPVEPEKQEDKEPEVQKLVPHGAFEEERQRRKAAQQEAQRERENNARLQGQLEALRAGQKPENLTPQEAADWDKNPIAAGKALQARLDQQAEDAKKAETERAEYERISAIGSRHAERFAKTQPHLMDTTGADGKTVQGAYGFMRIKTAEWYQSLYPNATEAQVIDAVNAEERLHIQRCLVAGENCAEALWELALKNGYKVPEAPKPRDEKGQFQKSEAERIADLEKAQRASRSLGAVPAGGGEPELSMSALADMDDAEFAAATKDGNWEKLHRKGVI